MFLQYYVTESATGNRVNIEIDAATNRSFLILSTFNDNHFLCGNVSDGCSVLSSGLTKRSIRWFLFPMTMAAAGGKQFCRLRRFILSHGRTRDRAGFSAAVNR